MAGITTAMAGSFKAELMMGAHVFAATVTPTGNTYSNNVLDNLSALTGMMVGQSLSFSGSGANAVIERFTSASALVMSEPASTSLTGTTVTAIGDVFNFALITHSPTGTYGASTTNYSNITGNSDEASGTGYTAGGQALSANISPSNSGANAFVSWTGNPTWTGATLDVDGGEIHNTAARLANVTGRTVAVFDFGGEQKVTNGTFVILLPSNAASTSILQIN